MLSHVGGYLADYMMTEYRSRAGYPCHCTFVKNWVYHTIYEEIKDHLGEDSRDLLHSMLYDWGRTNEVTNAGPERVGDVFETSVALCFYMNDWKPIYQLVEYAVLHEMKEFHRNKNPSYDNAKLLELAAAAVNFTRETSLLLAGIGPPVPLQSGLEDISMPKSVSPSSQDSEWKNILSKKERQELEAMSDLAQGVVCTAIAKQG